MSVFDAAVAEAKEVGLELRSNPDGVVLCGDGMELVASLDHMTPRLRRDRLACELLVRAAKVNVKDGQAPTAVDATAGLGEDSLLLAAAGFEVTLLEHDPLIYVLLASALDRARTSDDLHNAAARMSASLRDSIEALLEMRDSGMRPDVIYLDPMFPERAKSAAVKKKFQLLHRIERPCQDEDSLMRAAIACEPRKIVVKRPAKGPCLAGVRPSYSLAGKSVRYDVIVPANGIRI